MDGHTDDDAPDGCGDLFKVDFQRFVVAFTRAGAVVSSVFHRATSADKLVIENKILITAHPAVFPQQKSAGIQFRRLG